MYNLQVVLVNVTLTSNRDVQVSGMALTVKCKDPTRLKTANICVCSIRSWSLENEHIVLRQVNLLEDHSGVSSFF